LVITPKKTGRYNKDVKQPLNKKALEIFSKYGQDMTTLKITNQAYNKELKEMFNLIRAEKPELKFGVYGTHSGRDTFITMCVQAGVDWKSILGWVGQSSYAIMDRYIDLNDRYQVEQMEKLH
jgi:integrase